MQNDPNYRETVINATSTADQRKLVVDIKSLTSIRFFFAFTVVLGHIGIFFPDYYSPFLLGLARYAVTGFYILSGMIMTHVYHEIDFSYAKNRYIYYLKRIIRIYPLYILPLILFIPIKLSIDSMAGQSFDSYPESQIAYINNTTWLNFVLQFFSLQSITAGLFSAQFSWNSPDWSISTELFFYFTFPLTCLLTKKANKWVCFTILSICLIFTTYVHLILLNSPKFPEVLPYTGLVPFLYMNPLVRVVDFTIGIILYKIFLHISHPQILTQANLREDKEQAIKESSTQSKYSLSNSIVFYTFLFFSGLEISLFIIDKTHSGYFLLPAYITLLLMYLLIHNPAILCGKFLVTLGDASYGIYLFHFVFLSYYLGMVNMFALTANILTISLAILIIMLFSIFIYKRYEKPSSKYLKKKFNIT